MKEGDVEFDHAAVKQRVFNYIPILEVEFKKGKETVSTRGQMDETYIKVKGKWYYLYCIADSSPPPILRAIRLV